MSDADELRTLDVRIAKELFGWSPPPFGRPPLGLSRTSLPISRPLANYATNWNAIPRLVERCTERGWGFGFHHDPALIEPWCVCLSLANGVWRTRGGDSLPLALCRAIVAVLDATEEATKEARKA